MQLPTDMTDIDDAIETLKFQTRKLQISALRTAVFTATNIIVSIALMLTKFSLGAVYFDFISVRVILAAVPLVTFIFALILLFLYDQGRRRGDAFFEEISDELEWYLKRSREYLGTVADLLGREPSLREPPQFRARVALREFVLTTPLPFATGSSGVAKYALINLMVSLPSTIVTIIPF